MRKKRSDIIVILKPESKVLDLEEIDKIDEVIKVTVAYNNGGKIGEFTLREVKEKFLEGTKEIDKSVEEFWKIKI